MESKDEELLVVGNEKEEESRDGKGEDGPMHAVDHTPKLRHTRSSVRKAVVQQGASKSDVRADDSQAERADAHLDGKSRGSGSSAAGWSDARRKLKSRVPAAPAAATTAACGGSHAVADAAAAAMPSVLAASATAAMPSTVTASALAVACAPAAAIHATTVPTDASLHEVVSASASPSAVVSVPAAPCAVSRAPMGDSEQQGAEKRTAPQAAGATAAAAASGGDAVQRGGPCNGINSIRQRIAMLQQNHQQQQQQAAVTPRGSRSVTRSAVKQAISHLKESANKARRHADVAASDAYRGSQDVVPAPLAIEPCAAADAGVKLETPGVRASTRLLGTSRSRGGSRGRGSSGSSSSLSFVTAGDKLPSGAEGLTPTPTTAIIPATAAAAAATSGEGATGTTEGAAANAEAVVKTAAATACV